MDKRQTEIIRGGEARQLIENPIFKEAVESVRAGIVNAMSHSALGDEKTHNRLVISLQLLNQIEKSIKTHIETGRMAELQTEGSMMDKLRRVA